MLYGFLPLVGRLCIIKIIKKIDGGEFWSNTLREIFLKYHNIEIGIGSYGCFNLNRIPNGTRIGNYCSIGKNVFIMSGNHPMHFISTHPIFYNSNMGYVVSDKIQRTKLIIGHDVWIGFGAKILPSVNYIGNGAVIGAGSVVTKNVDPFIIVAGNPAKIINRRFDPDICNMIEDSDWFLNEPYVLSPYIDFASTPLEFIYKIKGVKK